MRSHLLLLLVVFYVSHSRALECYTCASMELKAKWYITQFPKIISDDLFFVGQCDDSRYLPLWPTVKKLCNTACVTMHIQDVEVRDSWTLDKEYGGNYTVRGCLNDLIGYDPGIEQTNQCFKGIIPTVEGNGQTLNPLIEVKFCHEDYCNKDVDFVPDGQCNDRFQNNAPISCRLCDTTTMKCEQGYTCSGLYCLKTSAYFPNGSYHMMQSCAPFSLYGNVLSKCEDIIYNGTKYTNCYCRNASMCNKSYRPREAKNIVFVLILIIALPDIVKIIFPDMESN